MIELCLCVIKPVKDFFDDFTVFPEGSMRKVCRGGIDPLGWTIYDFCSVPKPGEMCLRECLQCL